VKVVVATRNRHKLREIAVLLAEAGLDLEAIAIDQLAPQAELVEDEDTFEGNALAKARQAAAA
jgi:XTP/dITP diphosphohydrolase